MRGTASPRARPAIKWAQYVGTRATPGVARPCASAATRYLAVTRAMVTDAPLARKADAASAVRSLIDSTGMRERYSIDRIIPPSTRCAAPLMAEALAEHRNTTWS